MPGYIHIAGYLHMSIQTAVLIETLKSLSSYLYFFSCNIFSNQDHTVAAITYDEFVAVFSWKGESFG